MKITLLLISVVAALCIPSAQADQHVTVKHALTPEGTQKAGEALGVAITGIAARGKGSVILQYPLASSLILTHSNLYKFTV